VKGIFLCGIWLSRGEKFRILWKIRCVEMCSFMYLVFLFCNIVHCVLSNSILGMRPLQDWFIMIDDIPLMFKRKYNNLAFYIKLNILWKLDVWQAQYLLIQWLQFINIYGHIRSLLNWPMCVVLQYLIRDGIHELQSLIKYTLICYIIPWIVGPWWRLKQSRNMSERI
jgi:hypothetical protein